MIKRLTIHDVAKEAGCSIATVSLVLNNSGRIGPDTRHRVTEIIKTLGYQPNTSGRNLRLQRTDTIGLMFNPSPSKIFKNIFYIDMMEGLEEKLCQRGFSLLLGSGREELARDNLPKFMRTGAVDALILMGHFPENTLDVLLRTRTPVLLLDSLHPHKEVDCLTSDGFSGASQAVDHLVSIGHTRIAMLSYDILEYHNVMTRIDGFRTAIKRHGLDARINPVVHDFAINEDLPAKIDAMLADPEGPTAFICVNDTLAVYVTDYLMDRGVNVPEHVSVIGFDDDTIARTHQPPLTTVRIDSFFLGAKASELVIERLKAPQEPVRKIIVPVELIVRESTGAPPAIRPVWPRK
ncbi:MAG TPA: LacI family DNA-binding transcriptional regulator [Rariglobus sp.]|jgi:LacI family transcriptional regulator|nr:LacI family DNA-binding transcriptional regulator [Rariglobus sp.]